MNNLGKIFAVAVLTRVSLKSITGKIEFCEFNDKKSGKNLVKIKVDIKGLPPGKHGFHIHQAGDLTHDCASACAHFDPYGNVHGGPNSKIRHVGDLGNITANKNGVAKKTFFDHKIKLKGRNSIIGRSVVIHQDEDDLGLGGVDRFGNIVDPDLRKESLITGNAGPRIACGVIGYSQKNFI